MRFNFCEVHKHKYGIKFRRWCEVRILQNKLSHQHIFVTAIFVYYPMLCSLVIDMYATKTWKNTKKT